MIKEGYDRISQILAPFSGLEKIDREILENASMRGTTTHKLIEALSHNLCIFPEEYDKLFEYCRNPEHRVEEEKKVGLMVESYKLWAKGKRFLPKTPRFYDHANMLTGEIDDIYVENGDLILVDYKTPASESKTWLIQANGYDYLASWSGLKFVRLEFIKLSKEGKMAKTYVYEKNHELFHSVVETYRYFYKGKIEVDEHVDYL